MNKPLPIDAAVDVDAPAGTVWSIVSDVARMGEWSPECRKVLLVGAKTADLGVRMVGINKRRLVVWPTWSRIVRFEPGRAIAWRTRESAATWTYELESTAAGTRLVARRAVGGFSVPTKLLAPLLGGAAGHDRELADGLRATLERIKAEAES
ncbi:MAG: SRPBCC family protein [Propionibacteriales bacterium]|nr:SRPBCC family protein [Propionibacteriales bacterium]